MHTVKGTFEIQAFPEPPYDTRGGVTLGRMRFEKKFSGPLEGTSTVHMLAARTPVKDSAGYVALERIEGTVEGTRGAFVVQHVGVMSKGSQSLSVTVVPDSGTDELAGISGEMKIDIVDGQHHYELRYQLG